MKSFQQMSQRERDIVIRMLLAEAGNQGPEGQRAVAAVIGNRANQSGMTPGQVVTAKGQFEPWGTASGRAKLAGYDPNSPAYRQAAQALDDVATTGRDPTGGATHFFAPKAQAAMGRPAPSWAQGQGTDIGGHRFYNLGYQSGNRHGIPPRPPGDIPSAPLTPPQPLQPPRPPQPPGPGYLTGGRYDNGFLPEASPGYRAPMTPPQGGYEPGPQMIDPEPMSRAVEPPPKEADPIREIAEVLGLSKADQKNFELGLALGGSDSFPLFGGYENSGAGSVG